MNPCIVLFFEQLSYRFTVRIIFFIIIYNI